MARYRGMVAGATSLVLITGITTAASPALGATSTAGAGTSTASCTAGAQTLAPPGSRLYPDTGNGGYTSLHTDVHLVYDATDNHFLPGNHVTLTDRATQCLTSFSLDFERRSVNTTAGPDMTVTSVQVNGRPASFTFVQPTYPGDPHGPGDPNPLAHQASETNPVGGPHHNPLPPACTPELTSTNPAHKESGNGTPCPATKLVITPATELCGGKKLQVTLASPDPAGVDNEREGNHKRWF
ncbi:MAG: hypothetical protein ACR2MP_16120, partial [Streptosporangiaceae bacterium]